MHGDYEAQRHWQEITVNLPLSDWYNQTKVIFKTYSNLGNYTYSFNFLIFIDFRSKFVIYKHFMFVFHQNISSFVPKCQNS